MTSKDLDLAFKVSSLRLTKWFNDGKEPPMWGSSYCKVNTHFVPDAARS